MANNYKIFNKGFGVVPKASSQSNENGDLEALLADGKLRYYNVNQATPNSPVVTEAHTATLTNKTIDADNNTISDLTNANLKNGVAAIANNNLAVMPTLTIKGNDGVSSLVPQDLTVAEVNTMLGTTGAATSIGNLDSQAANAQGLALVGQVLSTQSASATAPGMMNTGNQTFAGVKSFNKLALTQSVDSSSTGSLVNVTAPTTGTIIFTNVSLTSIQNIGAGDTGQLLTIKNSTGATITIKNDSGGTAANRIVTGLGIDITLVNTASLLLEYDGNASRWTVIGGSGGSNTFIVYDDFVGDSGTVDFTLSATPASVVNTNVYINGVYQEKSSYSLIAPGNIVRLSVAPVTGDTIEIVTGVNTTATITGNLTVFSDTGNGTNLGPYTLPVSPGSTNNTFVYLGGVYQNKSTYSVTGTALTFTTAPPNGVLIEVVIPSITDIGTPSNGTVGYAQTSPSLWIAPTIQLFTSGSGTYTLPSSPRAPLYIKVRMAGAGGGGGGGSQGGTATAGTAGNNTTFGSAFLTANGGSPGAGATTAGGAGGGSLGTATGGDINFTGGTGNRGMLYAGTVGVPNPGGAGGTNMFGGGGTTDYAAIANTGAGGGGGLSSGTANTAAGGGGQAGGYLEKIILSPSSTYSYNIGAKGTGGAGQGAGAAGTNGADGIIIVEEYYQ